MHVQNIENVSQKHVPVGRAQYSRRDVVGNGYGTELLDRIVPLDGASHAEVECYTVEIPMRYATCIAKLLNGRNVRFLDTRNFVGWSGWEDKCSFLFRTGGLQIEIRTDPEHRMGQNAPGNVCDVILEATAKKNGRSRIRRPNGIRKFIATDGSQIVL